MAPKKNEPAKDKEDKDDATPGNRGKQPVNRDRQVPGLKALLCLKGRLKYQKQSQQSGSSRSLSPSLKLSPLSGCPSRSLSMSRSLKQSPLSPITSRSPSLRLKLSPLGWIPSQSLNRSLSPSSRLQRRLPGTRPVLETLVLEPVLPWLREEGFLNSSVCADEEVFGTEEEQRQRAAEKRTQALDITGTLGSERKTKLMIIASFNDFFDDTDESQG
eukprot:jgi/Tetstr1/443904/TSEL_031856.t1